MDDSQGGELMDCYSWSRPCDAPPDPCGNTNNPTQTTCAATQGWFWILAAVVIGGTILANAGKKK